MKYLTLVNEDNKLKESFVKRIEFLDYKNNDGNTIKVETKTLDSFYKLRDFLSDKDINIDIESGYDDSNLYSEFSTGLALSININSRDDSIIYDNLYKFGFIRRNNYIRYVGVVPASIMYHNNLTLEEYLSSFGCVVIVNKPKDVTSRDVVNDISHIFGLKKVGHTGTLDPLATGVLVVTIGSATKIGELLTATYKEYEAGVLLGVKTDTLDITGNVIKSKPIRDDINIDKVVNSYKKTYMQEVPIYSAVKIKGKKLYEYARANIDVELPKREVTIKDIKLLSSDRNTFVFRSLVSKGCYIRSLINDIGESLDTYATMTMLIRTKQGKFSIDDSYNVEDIRNNNFNVISIEDALDFPVISVSEEFSFKIKNGVRIKNDYGIEDKVIFKYNDKLLGIYQVDGDMLKTWKNFR